MGIMSPVVWVTRSKNIVAKTYNLPFAVRKMPTRQANLALLIIPDDVLVSLKCLQGILLECLPVDGTMLAAIDRKRFGVHHAVTSLRAFDVSSAKGQ